MIISVLSLKGGVGKTPISFTLAKDLNLDLQSNDNSIIETIYPKRAKIGKIELKDNTVYDFGGFADIGIIPVIKQSSAVIIPCSPDYNAIMRAIETLETVTKHNQNIIVAITKTEKEDGYVNTVNAIREYFDELNFFELRNSKIFRNSIESGKSILELYNETPLSRSAYKTIYNQYLEILNLFR